MVGLRVLRDLRGEIFWVGWGSVPSAPLWFNLLLINT